MTNPSLDSFGQQIAGSVNCGDLATAAAAAAACRKAWPADRAGWLAGSFVALLGNNKGYALQLVEERLVIEPTDLQCLVQKAECLFELGRRADALETVVTAANSSGINVEALDAIGECLAHAREHHRALDIYNRAIELASGDTTLRTKRAVLHRFLGNFDLATLDYDSVLAVEPMHADALKGHAELYRQSADRNSVVAMEAALAARPTDSKNSATLHFALAKSYEDMGDFTASWRHLNNGNDLERTNIHYDSRLDREAFEQIVTAFPAVEEPTIDSTGESPIFIVGLPRSGTTLAERIIGNHSQVHAAGELSALSEAISTTMGKKVALGTLDWTAFAALLGGLDSPSIAREYLERARARRGDRTRFSDKQTANFYHCALIFRAFPAARVVHVTRHPVAACYAMYKNRFPGTFPFASNLIELADFYVGYRKLMTHWHRVLPGRILDVAYEEIVGEQESTTRRMLNYAGLTFEKACLEFELNPTSTTTASSVQVRQRLYISSVHQWQHYAAQLAPLRSRLEAAGIEVK